VLISQNWFRSITHSGNAGFSKEEIYPVEVAAVLSGAVAVVLALVCVWKARSLLERGSRVGGGIWIQSYLCLFYALPLLWHQQSSSTSVASDGSTTVVSRGYGHELSIWIFCFAVAGLLLLQIVIRLSRVKKTPNQSLQPTGLLARG
jgi:hypothetical protein